jgi:hypothetical protein
LLQSQETQQKVKRTQTLSQSTDKQNAQTDGGISASYQEGPVQLLQKQANMRILTALLSTSGEIRIYIKQVKASYTTSFHGP